MNSFRDARCRTSNPTALPVVETQAIMEGSFGKRICYNVHLLVGSRSDLIVTWTSAAVVFCHLQWCGSVPQYNCVLLPCPGWRGSPQGGGPQLGESHKIPGRAGIEFLSDYLVALTKMYHNVLYESVVKNFLDNGGIACISHNTCIILVSIKVLTSTEESYVIQLESICGGEGFRRLLPRDPMSHTIHIAAMPYKGIYTGECMFPDRCTFHLLHPAAEYHASTQAISSEAPNYTWAEFQIAVFV